MNENHALQSLYKRPGFLIRRANQIAVSIFLDEMDKAVPGLTSTQYGALVVLSAQGAITQTQLARLVGIDRSTTALVVGKLEENGFIRRTASPNDKRRKMVTLTDDGRSILAAVAEPAELARQRLLSALSRKEGETLIKVLEKLVSRFNDETRAPIEDMKS
jgi:MarR family transcriptional regulator, lower aerobic nicotinate degradation pathway regulator